MNTKLPRSEVLIARVPSEPQLRPELVLLRETIAQDTARHLVLDLSQVDIITSASIGCLMLLQKTLLAKGCRLILCGARLATMATFRVLNLESFFEFCEDGHLVLQTPHETDKPQVGNCSAET